MKDAGLSRLSENRQLDIVSFNAVRIDVASEVVIEPLPEIRVINARLPILELFIIPRRADNGGVLGVAFALINTGACTLIRIPGEGLYLDLHNVLS